MSKIDADYLYLLDEIVNGGCWKDSRSGPVMSLFGKTIEFNLQKGFPLLTIKKMFTKGVIYELLWFLRGDTNIRFLTEHNVHIWDKDAFRYFKSRPESEPYRDITIEAFLKMVSDEEKLSDDYTAGDLGEVYGAKWRNWNGIDQLGNIVEKLKTNPDDRRMLCVAYDPSVADRCALPPCHITFQFWTKKLDAMERLDWLQRNRDGYDEWKSVTHGKLDELGVPRRALSLSWNQRSVDVALGLPFNIASYGLLCCMVAHCVGMIPDMLIGFLGDCHIYENQMDGVDELLKRSPYVYHNPELVLNPDVKDLFSFTYDDIKIRNYESFPPVEMPLSVG